MMEYKVGDEILIKAVITGSREDESKLLVRTTRNSFLVEKKDVIPAQDMTAEEAWEIAKNLFVEYSNIELDEIFGKEWSFLKLMELTPQEAKAKIEAWEAEKEIKVGDVVRSKHYESREYLVTYISKNRIMAGVCLQTGEVIPEKSEVSTNSMVKTGRHINIDEILKQIGGTDA